MLKAAAVLSLIFLVFHSDLPDWIRQHIFFVLILVIFLEVAVYFWKPWGRILAMILVLFVSPFIFLSPIVQALFLVGGSLNVLVMAANHGYMPVSSRAAERKKISEKDFGSQHIMANASTRLPILMDRFSSGYVGWGVWSIGDALIYSGLVTEAAIAFERWITT